MSGTTGRVSHNRRARPTVRMLAEDLPSGWDCVQHLRSIRTESWTDLHPLAALDHPIIRKAAGQLGPEPEQANWRSARRRQACSGVPYGAARADDPAGLAATRDLLLRSDTTWTAKDRRAIGDSLQAQIDQVRQADPAGGDTIF